VRKGKVPGKKVKNLEPIRGKKDSSKKRQQPKKGKKQKDKERNPVGAE